MTKTTNQKIVFNQDFTKALKTAEELVDSGEWEFVTHSVITDQPNPMASPNARRPSYLLITLRRAKGETL